MTKFQNLPSQDEEIEIFSVKEFFNVVKNGLYNEYDGSGFWANDIQKSNEPVKWNERNFGKPEWATKVCWYPA